MSEAGSGMKVLYGSSPALYGGTSYGSKVEGAPRMVRQFKVTGETSRSYLLLGGLNLSKKSMVLDTGGFTISMFPTVEQAVAALSQ